MTTTLTRWRSEPIKFIESVLCDPQTGEPFILSEVQRQFLQLAFALDANGRLLYPEQLFGAIKKSGKTTLAAMITITMVLLFGGRFAEGYCVANDYEQAVSRVFEMIRRIIEASPLLKREAKLTADRVTFPALTASIVALASNAASAAGANPVITVFDELWGYTSERSRRLFDEMIFTPARKVSCRLTVSYAGFEGESILLEELYRRGLRQPQVALDLYAGNGMLCAWHREPIAPWQTPEWLEEMRRSLRPLAFRRMITNEFVTSESSFVNMPNWDACVQPSLMPVASDKQLPVWVGVDAALRRDSAALVAVTCADKKTVRLVTHRVFTPSPGDPLNFEETIEQTILDWAKRFRVRKVWFDPYQMVSVSQRLAKAHIAVEEYAQTIPNLTAATSNLFDLIQSRQLVLYPDNAMRTAVSQAIIVESSRGWRLDKLKQSHSIDSIVALSMAALAAIRGQEVSSFSLYSGWLDDDPDDKAAADAFQQARLRQYIFELSGGRCWP